MKNKKNIFIAILAILMLFVLTGCSSDPKDTTAPIQGFNGLMDIFVYPMASIMWLIGNTIGFHNYPVTIIITTLVVRTIAWPIYGKTNDMQLKMQLVQPEMEKIQKRYEGKEDQESKQRMSMETMQLYKKYGIGLGGCLMPFIQMPIFLGFYRTISRMPSSIDVKNWIGKVFESTEIFGVDMILCQNEGFDKYGNIITASGWTDQKIGVLILAILVGITQIISIIISNIRQKKQQEKQVSNIPEYRRPQQNDQQKMTNASMKVMLYFMAAMMVMFVWQSPAGLGLYWVVGNIYSTLQSWLGQLNSAKRLEKLKQKQLKKGR